MCNKKLSKIDLNQIPLLVTTNCHTSRMFISDFVNIYLTTIPIMIGDWSAAQDRKETTYLELLWLADYFLIIIVLYIS